VQDTARYVCLFRVRCISKKKKLKTKPRGLSPRANYIDRAAAACQKCLLLLVEGCRVVSATVPYGRSLCFLDQSCYFFFQVALQLYSRGWVDPDPEPPLLRKSGSTGNRTGTSGSVARTLPSRPQRPSRFISQAPNPHYVLALHCHLHMYVKVFCRTLLSLWSVFFSIVAFFLKRMSEIVATSDEPVTLARWIISMEHLPESLVKETRNGWSETRPNFTLSISNPVWIILGLIPCRCNEKPAISHIF
jgi:hypothetical protein